MEHDPATSDLRPVAVAPAELIPPPEPFHRTYRDAPTVRRHRPLARRRFRTLRPPGVAIRARNPCRRSRRRRFGWYVRFTFHASSGRARPTTIPSQCTHDYSRAPKRVSTESPSRPGGRPGTLRHRGAERAPTTVPRRPTPGIGIRLLHPLSPAVSSCGKAVDSVDSRGPANRFGSPSRGLSGAGPDAREGLPDACSRALAGPLPSSSSPLGMIAFIHKTLWTTCGFPVDAKWISRQGPRAGLASPGAEFQERTSTGDSLLRVRGIRPSTRPCSPTCERRLRAPSCHTQPPCIKTISKPCGWKP